MTYDSKQRFIHREMLDYLALNQQGLLLLMWLGEKEKTDTRAQFARCRRCNAPLTRARQWGNLCITLGAHFHLSFILQSLSTVLIKGAGLMTEDMQILTIAECQWLLPLVRPHVLPFCALGNRSTAWMTARLQFGIESLIFYSQLFHSVKTMNSISRKVFLTKNET